MRAGWPATHPACCLEWVGCGTPNVLPAQLVGPPALEGNTCALRTPLASAFRRTAATGTQLYEPNTGDKLSGWTVEGVSVSGLTLVHPSCWGAGEACGFSSRLKKAHQLVASAAPQKHRRVTH